MKAILIHVILNFMDEKHEINVACIDSDSQMLMSQEIIQMTDGTYS